VEYKDVYPGINLLFYGRGREMEFDWIVSPGANPGAIRMAFGGAKPLLTASGDVRLGRVTLRQPVIYQGERRIEGGYITKAGEIAFRVGEYDHSQPLVIDPVLVFATMIGGSDQDTLWSVGVDAAGNVYSAGQSASTNFPTANAVNSTFAGVPFDAVVV
jgi:hypothetical protein